MKIIQRGREQTGWAKQCTCSGVGNDGGGCGAILLVEQGDLFLTHSYHRDETDTFVTFRCVQCKVLTDLPAGTFSNYYILPDQFTWEKAHIHDGTYLA